MYTTYEFKIINDSIWMDFCDIVNEYNKYAEEYDFPKIKITKISKTIVYIKEIMDGIFFNITNEDEFLENNKFPKRIYGVYKKIYDNKDKISGNYYTIDRVITEKLWKMKDPPLAMAVYMSFKYYSKDQESDFCEKGETFVGINKIAGNVGRSPRRVQAIVKLLKDEGIIVNKINTKIKRQVRIIK